MNSNEMPQTPVAGSSGMAPNVAGALSYIFGVLSGVIFLVIERDRFVRFHAFQSILFSAAWVGLWIALTIVSTVLSVLPLAGYLIGLLISVLVWAGLALGGLALWLVLIVMAAQGRRWKLPVIGDMAERMAESQ
jgi:uncharacterized membrane protein